MGVPPPYGLIRQPLAHADSNGFDRIQPPNPRFFGATPSVPRTPSPLTARRPGLVDDARAVAQRDLGTGPALDRRLEGHLRQQEIIHAGQVLVEV